MRIQHNIMAMNAYRNYANNTSALSKNLEKLSSGYKINRAGDDAAATVDSTARRSAALARSLDGCETGGKTIETVTWAAVDEGGNVATGGLGSFTQVVVHLEVIFRSAVGAVQTSHVHTCFDKAGDTFEGFGGGTDGIYDLGFTHIAYSLTTAVYCKRTRTTLSST